MKAIITTSNKSAILAPSHPTPTLRPDYILVRTVAVALNPTDWKHVDYMAPAGVTVGCDYAGIVEEVGPDVKRPFKKGDRICGFAHGCNSVQPQDGSFAEYIVVKGDLQIQIPDNLTFQEAATLGVGVSTVGQGLYQSLKLPLPEVKGPAIQAVEKVSPTTEEGAKKTILIYGGSTATGTLAIQFAKLSGYHVITTCSKRNFDLVKGLGADVAFDYNDSDAAAKIREYTSDRLKLVFDTISVEQSVKFCDDALSTTGGEYSALLNVKFPRENVNDRMTLAYTCIGEAFDFGPTKFPAIPADKEFAEKFWELSRELLAQGKVKVHPVKVNGGGLQGVLEGLQLMREGKVSGEKLVYNVADTQ